MSKKIVNMVEKVNINHATGEIKSSEKISVFRVPKEPAYVKLYIDDMATLLSLKSGPTSLVHALIKRMDYEGYISLNPMIRNLIASDIKVSVQTLRNYLQDLKKSGFILPMGINCFKINPNYFAKGDWNSVLRQRKEYDGLEMKIRYNSNGTKEISSSIITDIDK